MRMDYFINDDDNGINIQHPAKKMYSGKVSKTDPIPLIVNNQSRST
jgi:hypothetical protein